MNARALLIAFSIGLLLTTVAVVGKQNRRLQDLRREAMELEGQIAALPILTANAEPQSPDQAAARSSPSLELLRLRSQVGQLERRKRELAGQAVEHQKLQAQLAAAPAARSGAVPLPEGYLRRSAARNVGFGTPEDALQTFLWAIEHRDLPTLLQFFGPEQAKQMAAEVERRGSLEEFFKEAGVIPGMRITGREQKDDGTIVLNVQIAPEDAEGTQKMPFKQSNGQWRVTSGF